MAETHYVNGDFGGKWHISRHAPSGYGVWTFCGRSFPGRDFKHRTIPPARRDGVCKRCEKLHAAGGGGQ